MVVYTTQPVGAILGGKMSNPLQVILVFVHAEYWDRIWAALRECGYDAVGPQVTSASELESELSSGLEVVFCEDDPEKIDPLTVLETIACKGLAIPVIAIGAEGQTERVVTCIQRGVANYLTPETLNRLGDAVRQAQETRARQEARTHQETRAGRNSLHSQQQEPDHFRTMFEKMPDIACFKDGQGRWQDANQAALHLFQLEEIDYHGKTDSELALLSPHFCESFFTCQQTDETAWNSGETSRSEETIPTPDGDRILDIYKLPFYEADRRRKELLVLGRDITARKQMEAALRTREAELARCQEIAHLGNWIWTEQDNKILCSEELCRIIGIPAGTPLDYRHWLCLIHPEDQGVVAEKLQHFFRNPEEHCEIVFRIFRTNGQMCWERLWGVAPTMKDGHVVEIWGVTQDITEQVLSEQREVENRNRYQQVFDHSPVGIMYYNQNGVTECNERLAIILHTTREVVLKPEFEKFRDSVVMPALETALQGEEGFYEGPYRIPVNNKKIWITLRTAPLYDALGNVKGGIAIVEDINQQKMAEIQANRQMQRMAALHNVDVAITSSLDVHMTLNMVLDQAISHLSIDAASIRLFNRFTQTLDFAVGKGFRTGTLPRRSLRLGEGLSGRAALEHRNLRYPEVSDNSGTDAPESLWIMSEYTACCAVPLISKGQVKGVLEIYKNGTIPQHQDWLDFLNALAMQAAIAVDNSELFDNLQRTNIDLSLMYDSTLVSLIQAVDRRERMPETHARSVADLSMRLARAVGIPDNELTAVRRGALFHDIGKLVVPEHILVKSGPLTPEEWKIVETHPAYAFQMLSPISYLHNALDIPYCHHEHWDGSGYPRKLIGEQIPLAARVFAVADIWDVLRTRRPYREAWPKERIRTYIQDQAGILFDPKIVWTFFDHFWDELAA
jgi:PAS domain S-box-containing protein